MKKTFKKVLTLLIFVCAAFSLFSCGGTQDDIPKDKTIVNVEIYQAGYGIEWLEFAIEKFNALYDKDKYFVRINNADSSISGEKVVLGMKDIARNDVDIYFTNGVSIPTFFDASQSVMRNGGVLLEDLSDVYNSSAITFAGSLETLTIEEKMNASARKYYQYQESDNSKYGSLAGNYYSFPWATGPSGLFANKNVLAKYGYEIPRTTDELKAQYVDLMSKVRTDGVYPITFAGLNAMGYWLYLADTFFGQYSGGEDHYNFWNLPANEDGYKKYEDEGLLKALEVIEYLSNEDYAINGSNMFNIGVAQGELINGKALYMVNGNWIYHEMLKDYPEEVNNLIYVKTPIISALGTKLGITDEVLSAIVKDIDDGVDTETIVSKNAVTTDVVLTIKEARNVYFNSSLGHDAYIPSYSEEKEIAKLFLRFLASDDFLDEYKRFTYSALPFKYETTSKHVSNEYEKSVDVVFSNEDSIMLSEDLFTSIMRRKGNILYFGDATVPATFKALSQGDLNAFAIYEDSKNYAKDNWLAILSSLR